MAIKMLSIDSGSDAYLARVRVEMEIAVGFSPDPLEILIAEEEAFDDQLAEVLLSSSHRAARKQQRGIYAPHARSCMHNDDK